MRTLFVALFGVATLFGAVAVAEAASGPAAETAAQRDGERGGPDDPNCEDGISNDGDAFVDDQDPDCQKPGCRPSSATPNKCFEGTDDDGTGPTPGNCSNNQDDDGDGIPDSQEDECQAAGCVVRGVNTCNEVDDRQPPTPGNCSNNQDDDQDGIPDSQEDECRAAGCVDRGVNICNEVFDPPTGGADHCRVPPDNSLLSVFAENGAPIPPEYRDTLGQELYDALLSEIGAPLFEDPEHDGAVTGPIGEAAHGFPPPEFPAQLAELAELIQAGLFEVACLGDAVLEDGGTPLPDL